jgi:micrococcal nuclease
MYEYRAIIVNVVDGDTVDAVVDAGFKVTTTQRLRLLGVDTAELTAKDPVERAKAQEAKLFVIEQLLNKTVRIKTEKADSFGRYLATIYLKLLGGDETFNQLLLDKGLAEPYK